MGKSSAEYAFDREQEARGELRPEYSRDAIFEDFLPATAAEMSEAGDDMARKLAIAKQWFADRPHLFVSENSVIPEEKARAAFGAAPTLAAQAALVKAYGEAAAKAEAARWGTKLGSLAPGHLDGEPDAKIVAEAVKKAKAADDEGPSKNPWHPRWKASGKTDAERNAARLAAQTNVIRSFGSASAARLAKSAGVSLGGVPLVRK
jgi:hypothetical protein